MIAATLWGLVSSVMGLFYVGLQVMVPCLPPAPLSTSVINTDEYTGTWYFVAAAVWDEDDLKTLQTTDSIVLQIQKNSDSTLKVTETMRIGDACLKNVTNYYALPATSPFLFREDFDTIAVIWDGKYINCPTCIIMLYVGEDEEMNTFLFSRDEKTTEEAIQEFKSKTECLLMEDMWRAPLKNGYCKVDDSA
ncbi:apolipoprotein M [Danio rerio]|uniref:Apolipoprotein M n=1 Tax=Danio rerio TaxID=7955 RepID=A0A8M1NXE0_DANRE|nr:apolipoprotein M precursor [Danio rerio]|eukprot:NP_001186657.1 apolipoprotein M precursor [Danio rerio]